MTQGLPDTAPAPSPLAARRGTIAVLSNASHIEALWCHPEFDSFYFIDPFALAPHRSPAHAADIALADLRSHHITLNQARRIAATIPASGEAILFLVNDQITAPALSALCDRGRVYIGEPSASHLAHEMRDLLREQSISREAHRRARLFGGPNNSADHVSPSLPAILIAGAPGRHILSLINTLSSRHHPLHCAYRPGQAIRALESENIDGAVIFPATGNDPLLALARTMRRHSHHRATPVIVIAPDDEFLATTNIHGPLLSGDHIEAHGPALITATINRARCTTALLHTLRTGGAPEARGPRSRIWSAKSFAQWLGERCKDADQTGTPINFVMLKITRDKAGAPALPMTCETILDQAGPLMDRIIRAEDFLAHLATDRHSLTCVITLGQCTREDSARIAGRITSIIRSTVFHDDQKNPVPLSIEAAVFQRTGSLCPQETVAGLLGAIR